MAGNTPNYTDQGGSLGHVGGTLQIESGGALNFASGASLGLTGPTPSQPIGALTDNSTTTSGTTQSTEYPLNNITLPANAFSRTNSSIYVVAHGTLAANANAKTLKLYFGSTVVATVTGNTGNGVAFSIEMLVYRTGASTQRYHAWLSVNGTYSEFDGTATETDTATILVKSSAINTAAAAASATGTGMVLQFNS